MKMRITVISSLTVLVGLGGLPLAPPSSPVTRMLGIVPAPAFAMAPESAGGQQPTGEKKPAWKSNEEYQAFTAMATEKDPHKQIALCDAFLQKFGPTTDFKDQAYQLEMGAYQQLGDSNKAIDAAHKAVEANPSNIAALNYLAFAFPFVFKADAPDKDAKLTQAETDAKKGLEVLQNLKRPDTVAEDQFNDQVKQLRANFNGALGFVALQRKDYAAAITSLKTALEDNPANPYVNYRLGLSYLYSAPPDFDNAIWYLARADNLTKAAKSPDAGGIDKFFGQVYVGRHGSDQGEKDVLTQAAASVPPPAGFKVAPPEKHAATGNAAIDGFYSIEDSLRVGGDQANQAFQQLKGQPLSMGGSVDSVQKGTDPGTYMVRIDVTDESKAKDGVYDIELKDAQPDAKVLEKGDLVRFDGTITAYSVTPSFYLSLDGKINPDDLAAAVDKHKKPKAPVHHPTHRAQ